MCASKWKRWGYGESADILVLSIPVSIVIFSDIESGKKVVPLEFLLRFEERFHGCRIFEGALDLFFLGRPLPVIFTELLDVSSDIRYLGFGALTCRCVKFLFHGRELSLRFLERRSGVPLDARDA